MDRQPPQFKQLNELQTEIESTIATWELFDTYNGELEVLAKEEWITFRSQLFTFEDFLLGWSEKMRTRGL